MLDLVRNPSTCTLPLSQLRTRVWPLLLGLPESLDLGSVHPPGEEQERAMTAAEKRDLQVIACDLDRSLWAFTEGQHGVRFGDSQRHQSGRMLQGPCGLGGNW